LSSPATNIGFNELLNEYAKFLEIDLLRAEKTIKNHFKLFKKLSKILE
jgi:hypothetical protein